MTPIDPQTRLPIPPLDMQVTSLNLDVGQWLAGVSYAVVAAAAIYGLQQWRRGGSPMIPLLLIGGMLDGFVEPFVDITGGCWHPIIGQHTAFELVGRPIPDWVPPVYAAFYGGFAALIYAWCRSGLSVRGMWCLFAACLIAEPIAEGIMLHWEMYAYYGNQPLWMPGLPPLWWIPCNVMAIYLSALLALWSERRGSLLVAGFLGVFASPIIDAGATTLAGFPSMVAVNTPSLPGCATQACGIASCVICFAIMRHVIALFAVDAHSTRRAAFKALPV